MWGLFLFEVDMKLYFNKDGYINGELVFEKGKVYDVPEDGGSAARWMKRGAELHIEEKVEVKKPVKVKAKAKKVEKVEEKKEDVEVKQVKVEIEHELPEKDIL